MTKLEFLIKAQNHFANNIGPNAYYPCEIGEVDHHLWVCGNDSARRNNMAGRMPGYWDISILPFIRAPYVAIRIWTKDGGTGLNEKIESAVLEICKNCPGLCAKHAQQNGGDPLDGHGLYDFYREGADIASFATTESLKLMIKDILAIEGAMRKL